MTSLKPQIISNKRFMYINDIELLAVLTILIMVTRKNKTIVVVFAFAMSAFHSFFSLRRGLRIETKQHQQQQQVNKNIFSNRRQLA